jgi:hypothetical protein
MSGSPDREPGAVETAPAGEAARIVRPPNVLLAKAQQGGGKKLDELALKRAHMAILQARDSFLEVAEKDIARLAEATATLRPDDPDQGAGLHDIGLIAHEIRSFGSTHGYPLLTIIGTSLQKFVDQMDRVGRIQIEIVEHHIAAMRNVVRERIDGNGGELGAALTTTLRQVVSKYGG